MNEAEYLMKNYGDRGDLHNSSYNTKAEFNNCFIIIDSKYFPDSDWLKAHA